MHEEAVAISGPALEYFRLITLRAALRLEIIGMRRSKSPSAFSLVKHELGIRKGSKEYVLRMLDKRLKELPS